MVKANDSGQTLVEFGISLPIFLLLILGVIDFGYLFSIKVTLQNAVRQGGRYAITGGCITGSDGTCSQTRYNSILQTVENAAIGRLNSSQISITCQDAGGGCPNGAGGPGDVVTITVTYPYHFMTGPIGAFFPGKSYTITVSSAFTNEIFPPSQS
ncbi:MAG: TadE/TadG family type IV pilus assembly protein [Terriglobales bacterium]